MTDFDAFIAAVESLDGDERFTVMGDECPVIPPDDDFGYEATPKSAMVFGMMGVDGVHYAILKRNGEIRDDSPVIHVSPTDSDSPLSLLAHTFLDYLATACDVDSLKMRSILDRERTFGNALVPFMRDRFSHSRFDLDGFGSQITLYSGLLVDAGTQDGG
ncbi:hypothetical protein LF1_52010 [Rubripirellula obstinata]|uniref:Uncharacterized protein n=1 Tax=Rubripirellula obstinata TaxID=406547 RepID=A0A5B1CAQ3_9BACT|nr:hypothetical protein [Rubripirellula obstinata]KAA1257352.1 hypothetical protein LF1_52010 [Rubripirellula obstinata]